MSASKAYKAKWELSPKTFRKYDEARERAHGIRANVGTNVLLTKAFDPDGRDVWLVWVDVKDEPRT